MGGCMPKLSVEGSRHKWCVRTDDFVCDGTMFRHTEVSWEDAPVEFKHSHEVEASQDAPVRSMNYEHKIEDLMPFDCHVYWEPVWEKCPVCHKADQGFKAWAKRASTPAAMAAQKRAVLRDRLVAKGQAALARAQAAQGRRTRMSRRTLCISSSAACMSLLRGRRRTPRRSSSDI